MAGVLTSCASSHSATVTSTLFAPADFNSFAPTDFNSFAPTDFNSFAPADFTSANALAPADFTSVNTFIPGVIPGDFDPANIDDAEDFQLSRDQRFGRSLTVEEIDRAIHDRIPERTRRSTQWAMSVFRAWCEVRGIYEKVEALSVKKLSELLPCFVLEARRQDGSPYPPNTLVMLIAGIQRHLRETGRPELAILKEDEPMFARTRAALDARMKSLTQQGIGTTRKQAEPLSVEQENQLWEKGVFSLNSGWGLTYALFWYNCKLFGLRGGDEHRSLTREQFAVGHDEMGRFLRFNGRSSKNVQGGLKQRKVQFKDLKIYSRPELGERCVVDLFNHYFGFVPKEGPFYRKPLGNDPPKFSAQVLGKNKLAGLVNEMCRHAGFSGNYTNHSGKVTCATRLFSSNIDEQLIMRQTGHRSNAVRAYKRAGPEHDQMISDVLQPPACKGLKLEAAAEKSVSRCGEEEKENIPAPKSVSLPRGIVLNFNF